MSHLESLLLTSFTIHVPDWLFSLQALIIFLIGLFVGVLLGRARGRRY
jgi:hypothetical protein